MSVSSVSFRVGSAKENDFSCADGEVALAAACVCDVDDMWRPAPSFSLAMRLPPGYSLVAVHKGVASFGSFCNYLFLGPHSGLYFCPDSSLPPRGDVVDVSLLVPVADNSLSAPLSVASLGEWLSIASASAMLSLRVCPSGYKVFSGAVAPAQLEFGMVRAGSLSSSGFVAASRAGQGSSSTHPESSKSDSLSSAADALSVYYDAVARQAESRGFFHRPFLLRHAIRLSDGSLAGVSSPVLMLPWVLPPCIAVSEQVSEGAVSFSADLSRCLYFRLCMRLRSPLPCAVIGEAVALELFATPMFDVCDDTGVPACATTYGHLANAVNSGFRGRGGAAAMPDVFAGRFDDGTGVHSDHSVASMSLADVRCLDLRPNPHLADDIVHASRFYRIASVPVSALSVTDHFVDVPVESTAFTDLLSRPQLVDDAALRHDILPDAVYAFANRLFYAGGVWRVAAPQPPCVSEQFVGHVSAAPQSESAVVSVYVKSPHGNAVRSAQYLLPAGMTEALHRFVFYPDPSACLITVRRGDVCSSFPLVPHPSLHGAVWFGGLQGALPETSATPPFSDRDVSDCVPRHGAVVASMPGNPLVPDFSSVMDLGHRITALCAALEAPSRSLFGQFPLYAFTDEGVFSVDVSGHRAVLFRRTSAAPEAVVPWHRSVVAVFANRLFRFTGSECQQILCRFPSLPGFFTRWPSESLPPSLRFLPVAPLSASFPPPLSGISSPSLSATSPAGSSPALMPVAEGVALIYLDSPPCLLDPDSGAVSLLLPDAPLAEWADAPHTEGAGHLYFPCKPVPGANLAVSADYVFDFGHVSPAMMVVTRPIKGGDVAGWRRLKALSVIGRTFESSLHEPTSRSSRFSVCLYGTADMEVWHLLQSSSDARIAIPAGNPWRAYSVVCWCGVNRSAPPELYGLALEWTGP